MEATFSLTPDMQPLVSVIVPAYNIADYLPACLDSLLRQSYKNLEIIVIDDGSRDATGEILDRYAARDPRIRAVHQPNSGVMTARKKALELASGAYVCFVDGDDYLPDHAIETLCMAAISAQADIVCGDYFRVTADYCVEVHSRQTQPERGLEYLKGLLALHTDGFLWGKLYRRPLFDQLDYSRPLQYAEDLYINVQAACRQPAVVHIPQCVYYYVRRAGSLSSHTMSIDFHIRFAEQVNHYLQDHLSAEAYSEVQPWFVLMKLYFYNMYVGKSSHTWIGDNPYVQQLYAELSEPEVQRLYRAGYTASQRAILNLNRHRGTVWMGKVLTTVLRIRQSILKRIKGLSQKGKKYAA